MTEREMSERSALTCEEVAELAGVYVLHALAADEAAVRAHLDGCVRPHPEFAEVGGVVPALAQLFEPVDAPVDLKSRVMAAVGAPARSASPPTVVASTPAPARTQAEADARVWEPPTTGQARPRRMSPLSWGMAAMAVTLIAVLGAWNVVLQSRAGEVEQRAAAAEQRASEVEQRAAAAEQRASEVEQRAAAAEQRASEVEQRAAAAEQRASEVEQRAQMIAQAIGASTDPDAEVAVLHGTGPAQGASGFAAFPVDGEGYIVMVDLPRAPAGQTYQAWYLVDGQASSAGLLTVGADGYAVLSGVEARQDAQQIALTIEPAGGVEVPSAEPVVAGELSA